MLFLEEKRKNSNEHPGKEGAFLSGRAHGEAERGRVTIILYLGPQGTREEAGLQQQLWMPLRRGWKGNYCGDGEGGRASTSRWTYGSVLKILSEIQEERNRWSGDEGMEGGWDGTGGVDAVDGAQGTG